MAHIDRPLDNLGHHFKGRLLAILIVLLIVISLVVATQYIHYPWASNAPSRISYAVHAPISINGNGEFNASNGVVSGDGSASNPYIIGGWDISTSTADGIYIESTTAHFIIRNCYSHATSVPTYHAAIHLEGCTNATLRDNNCSFQDFGIYLHQSSGNTIVNNTCRQFVGIYLETSSNHNVIENNNCSNSYDGICLYYSSDNNTVRENKCNSNTGLYGISLNESDNNLISDNMCNNNQGFSDPVIAISVNRSANNTLINNSCQNNDIGIQLSSHSIHNTIINNSCGENLYGNLVLGHNCDSNSLIKNNCTQSGSGITIYSSANRVDNNSCSDNNRGIYFGHRGSFLTYIEVTSYDNIVYNNLLYNNNQYGIEIDHASNNLVCNNTFIGNNGAGSVYDINHIQANDDGTDNWWNSSGYGNCWGDWTTPDIVPPFGIVDNPYNISGSAGIKDYFPLTILGADLYPPTTISSLSGTLGTNGWFKSSVIVSLHAIDLDGGVNATFYRIGTSGSWLNYSSPFVLSSQDNFTIQFYSMDNASNNETMKSVTFRIDSVKPTLTILTANNTEFSSDQVAIDFNASDATSGLYYFEFAFDGSDYFSNTSIANQTYTISGQVGGQLADGAHYVIIRFVDKAGNINETRLDFKVHNTPSLIAGIPDWTLFLVIIIMAVMIFASVLLMRRRRSPPMKLENMKAEPPESS
jgi:parallel beta-helix repeat protein